MAVMKKKGNKELPPISTASLPDVIFMILFFFMVSTTMRDQELLVRYKLPTATEVQKLEKKSLVSFIHIGQPTPAMQKKFGTAPRIQLNDSYRTEKDILDFIAAERDKLNESDRALMTVCLKADDQTKMGIITDVKQELRRANALKLSYAASKSIPDPIRKRSDAAASDRFLYAAITSAPSFGRTRAVPTGAARTPPKVAPRHGAAVCRRYAVPDRTRRRRPVLGPCAPICLSAVEPAPSPATASVPIRPHCRSGHAAKTGENDSVRIPTSIVCLSDSSKYDKIG